MVVINPIQDVELRRQVKNYTNSQKKNANSTKEGVIVNNCVKEDSTNIDDMYTSLIISDNAKMPKELRENKNSQINTFAPTAIVATGVMATIGMISHLIRKSAKINLNIQNEKKLQHLTRNICITDESIQGLYQIVQCPNQKTILAGTGVIALGAMGFMGKMVVDGLKDIWVKKKEADIQKNLQENLVAVETKSFSGKIQIVRSMLAQKAQCFSEYLTSNEKQPIAFKNFRKSATQTAFSGEAIKEKTSSNNNKKSISETAKCLALGTASILSIVGLCIFSLKNLTKSKADLEKYILARQKDIEEIVKSS